ncbi:hypothetical protein P3T76_014277 [Phytophthora citrophthora]|uniref:Uncharacterized protein n=1 Tax=Phytophthora citrophthora TaxID=4793 RepID=A0AAD9G1P6_9STRA|nr:hypothetical protein P3T76_014277 [Phytophthora citrophthora]
MSEQEVVVALAAALVHVRALDADPQASFTAVYNALEDVERLIFHHKEQFGVHSMHFQQGCEEFLLLSNTLAMKALQTSLPEDIITSEQCGDLLLRAEQHTRHTGYLRSLPEAQHVNRRRVFRLITLNNLSCHAKHTGKPLVAVNFLERALKLQLKTQTSDSSSSSTEIALTRLNLCAVLSQLQRHIAAAAHAKAAVAYFTSLQTDPLNGEIAQLMLVARYNLAVELEHLNDQDAAWRQYEAVLAVAERYQIQSDLVQSVRTILAQGKLITRVGSRQSSPRVQTSRVQTPRVQTPRVQTPRDTMSGGQELEVSGIPALHLNKDLRLDEKYISNVHSIAETTIHDVVQEAVGDLTRAVAKATEWLTDAVRGELVSQAVAAAEPPDKDPTSSEEGPTEISSSEQSDSVKSLHSQGDLPPLTLALTRTSSDMVRSVAKATVEAVMGEALGDIVQAVEKATEWLSQAVENELVCQSVVPGESVSTELDDNAPVTGGASIVSKDPEIAEVPEVVDVPQLSLQSSEISVSHLHELAKATAEEVVRQALDDVTKAIGNTTQSLTQIVQEELPERFIAEATPAENSPSFIADFNPPAPVPALQLPNSALTTPEQVAECHHIAVPFVNDIVSTALQQTKPAIPMESEEYANEEYEDYTPINSPTSTSRSPILSTRPPEPETQPEIPVNVVSGRATPPEPKVMPRKPSPITSKRGLGTPRLNENAPSSAPPALPSPRTNEIPAEPAASLLPPLVLPLVQSAGKTKRIKTPRKTPRVSASNDDEVYALDSSRSSSSRQTKHSSRVSIAAAELEITPKSSARAAALIYTQQPPSSRHHQHRHHKPKKLRDSATQTSPPPSPSLQPLPHQFLPGVHNENNSNEQLPKPQSKHSPRDTPPPENKKSESSNTLLAPLSKTALVISPSPDSSTKASSPSRSHKNHGHKPSPSKRSGYCQRCTFEGRSCKINDCLKHQALK